MTAAHRFELRGDLSERLSELARQTGQTSESLLEEAVERLMLDYADYEREIDEGLASAASGVGHSQDQVFQWLDDLAKGHVRPIPPPISN